MKQKLQKNNSNSYFGIITRGDIRKIDFDDIIFFESEGRKINVYTKYRKISFNGSIENIREKLDERFCSCHGSYEINLTKVNRFAGDSIEMEGGHLLPVSQRKSAELRRLFQTYLKKHFPCNLKDDIV